MYWYNSIVILNNNNETFIPIKDILLSQYIIITHKRRNLLNHNYDDQHQYITINDKR